MSESTFGAAPRLSSEDSAPTKAELQAENDELRAKLEEARTVIDEALGLEEDDEEEEDED